jgi:mannosyltransferase OCH1-like enzyme
MNQKNKIIITSSLTGSLCLIIFSAFITIFLIRIRRLDRGMTKLKIPQNLGQKNRALTDQSSTKVPTIIHRIWMQFKPNSSRNIPNKYRNYLVPSRKNTKGYTDALWRNENAKQLVKTLFPNIYPYYLAYKKPIQRADAFRYMMLYTFGGFYSDMDISIYDLNGLLKRYPDKKAFFFTELYLNDQQIEDSKHFPIRNGVPEDRERISNYFLGCVKGHPIMLDILDELVKRSNLEVKDDYDVIYTTGPDLVTTVIQRNRDKYPDLLVVSKEEADKTIQHHVDGSWRGM